MKKEPAAADAGAGDIPASRGNASPVDAVVADKHFRNSGESLKASRGESKRIKLVLRAEIESDEARVGRIFIDSAVDIVGLIVKNEISHKG